MGLMGAHLSEILLKWPQTHPLERKFQLGQMVFWIFVILLISIAPFVDAGAHIGGLLFGVDCGTICSPKSA